MSLSSVLTILVAVLGLANVVLAGRLGNRCGEKRHEGAGEGVGVPPTAGIGEHGSMASDSRT